MKFSDTVKKTIAAIAPTAGTLLVGPLGGLAGNFIARALGVENAPDPGKAIEELIISQKPEVVAQLRQAEIDLKKHLDDNGIRLEEIAAADRANARAREAAVRDNTPKVLAYLVVGATLLIEGYGALIGFPTVGDPVILGRILGTLDAASMSVLCYYFGTTLSSRHKDETLADIAKMP